MPPALGPAADGGLTAETASPPTGDEEATTSRLREPDRECDTRVAEEAAEGEAAGEPAAVEPGDAVVEPVDGDPGVTPTPNSGGLLDPV